MQAITVAIILILSVVFVGCFDLRDALPGHVTDDQTTTVKPGVVQRTADFSDDDLWAVLKEDNKKSKSSSGSQAKDKQTILKTMQAKLKSIKFDQVDTKLASRISSPYVQSANSVMQWISSITNIKKVVNCFDNIEIYFQSIINEASNNYTKKKVQLQVVEKQFKEKLYATLSSTRQCLISRLKAK
uniref:Cul n 7 allergen n=1 Tax=Culicoides nubeculosus TaxID=144565 RepID=D9IL17_CULNU|nr:Cul n 7 allergen [Culicoides nubeculosus]